MAADMGDRAEGATHQRRGNAAGTNAACSAPPLTANSSHGNNMMGSAVIDFTNLGENTHI